MKKALLNWKKWTNSWKTKLWINQSSYQKKNLKISRYNGLDN